MKRLKIRILSHDLLKTNKEDKLKRIFLTILAVFILFVVVNNTVIANDTALSALGDNVGPFEGTPDVVLDSEVINLDVYYNKTIVNIIFNLRNEGPTKTILVGFPDETASYNLQGDADEHPVIMGNINDFKAWVNNVAVITTEKEQINKEDDGHYPVNFRVLWHTWPVNFDAYKTTIIKNYYWVENGMNVMGERNFHYTLVTGAKWKGLIGNTKIYVNLKDGLTAKDILETGTTKGMKIVNDNKLMWEFSNFEPTQDNGLGYFTLYYKKNMIDTIRKRNLTDSDLSGMSPWELKVLRNEIYARHGRAFKTQSLRDYYNSTDWYKINPGYTDSLLNNFEKKNALFILNYEKKIGSKIIYKD